MSKKIKLKIINPESDDYEDEVDSISSYNAIGKFDILPDHANFICIIQKEIVIQKGKDVKNINIEKGVMKIHNNQAEIYLGL